MEGNPIRYSDLVAPDSAITDLIAQLNRLIETYESAKSKIQSAAAETAKSMQSLSGATEQEREQIALLTTESDKLAAAYRRSNDAESETFRRRQQVISAVKEQQRIDKLIVELNNSKEGSYNRLSAQYRLNKIRLNEMSAAERTATESGRKLEAETRAIYEQMNKMQMATGKAQLQVGHYERALGNALGVNSNFVSALTDTNRVSEMLEGTMAALKGPIGAVMVVAGSVTAAFKLFKESLHETQVTGDLLDNAAAGWTATWEYFQKAIATFDWRNFLQGAADAARAGYALKDALDEAFERENSIRLQRAALSEENAILEERARNTNLSNKERLDAAKQYLENMKPIYEQEKAEAKDLRDKQLEYLFAVTNRRKFASEEEREQAKEVFAANIQNYNLNRDMLAQAKAVVSARRTLRGGYIDADTIKAQNRIIETASEGVRAFADFMEQYGLTTDKEVAAYVAAEERVHRTNVAIYQDNKRFVTMTHTLEAQMTNERKKRQEDEAKSKKEQEKEAAKEAKRLKAEQKAREDAAKKEAALRLQMLVQEQQTIQMQIQITEQGTQEELSLRMALIEKQKQLELEKNRQAAKELRKDEIEIEAYYRQLALSAEADFYSKRAEEDLKASQKLAESEFSLLDKNERQKTIFRLEQERSRLKKVLEINKGALKKLSDTEVASIMAQIEAIDREIGKTGYNNIYEVLGLSISSEQQKALDTALGSVQDALGGVIDSWKGVADAARKAADEQVSSAERALEAEIEARNNGYANSVETARKQLELAKKSQKEATEQQAAAQRAQIAMDTITQSSSLITASANLWKAFSNVPIVGPALAVTAISLMWGSFLASKIKAASAAGVEQYGSGTIELLEGGSHASGNDIDLGRKKDGTRRRAEGGEYFAVINKRSSRRYRNVIPDVINSLNDGTFADRYVAANAAMAGAAVGMGGTDVSGIERDVAAIRRQGDSGQYLDADGSMVFRYKNLTRKIKS